MKTLHFIKYLHSCSCLLTYWLSNKTSIRVMFYIVFRNWVARKDFYWTHIWTLRHWKKIFWRRLQTLRYILFNFKNITNFSSICFINNLSEVTYVNLCNSKTTLIYRIKEYLDWSGSLLKISRTNVQTFRSLSNADQLSNHGRLIKLIFDN